MSGGYLENYYSLKEWASDVKNDNPMLQDLLKDLYEVLYRYDYYRCGDSSKEDYLKEWGTFSNKWLTGEQFKPERLKELLLADCERKIENVLGMR